ncbi:MAG: type IV pilus modification protein PilV, partial [Gammaproteobacteria bacterium]|nr:type IV pilus modification protein PilV [Gammaproteobacteria bacterium]
MNVETMTAYSTQPSRTASAGFTLLEVLIAVVVLSIGLLGIAGLQTTGLRNNQDAYARTQATTLANDMADRIRANMAGFNAGNYDNTAAYTATCESSGCSPQQMAQHDTSLWNTALAALPSGQGTVASNAGLVTVTVMWD